MKPIKYPVAAIVLAALILAGCSGKSKDEVPDTPPAELYTTAQKKLQESNYKKAITELEALDSRYPFGDYAQQVQLDLIYAYYKAEQYPMAQASIDRFIRLNPTHKNIDYVLYMRGLTDMSMDESLLQDFLGIDRSDRDPHFAQLAFRDFSQLIRQFPNSEYASDAYKRLRFIKNRLAKHELAIARYYTKRGAYVAVINRVEQMMRDFPDTQSTRKALPLMEQAYRQLDLNDQAEKVAKIITANPASS